jgi:hypothetical protein
MPIQHRRRSVRDFGTLWKDVIVAYLVHCARNVRVQLNLRCTSVQGQMLKRDLSNMNVHCQPLHEGDPDS